MKRTIIIISIIQLLFFTFYNTIVYGVNPCELDIQLQPEIEQIKDSLEIKISVKNITEKVASVGFILNYDSDIFEIENVENCDGWSSLSRVENVFMFYTSNYEGTDKDSDIAKIKLKLIQSEIPEDFELGLKNVGIVGEDEVEIKMGDIVIKENDNSVIANDVIEERLTKQDNETEEQKIANNKWLYIILGVVATLFIILIIKIAYNNKKSET